MHLSIWWLNYKNVTIKRALFGAILCWGDLLWILLGCMWVRTKHAGRTRVGMWVIPMNLIGMHVSKDETCWNDSCWSVSHPYGSYWDASKWGQNMLEGLVLVCGSSQWILFGYIWVRTKHARRTRVGLCVISIDFIGMHVSEDETC